MTDVNFSVSGTKISGHVFLPEKPLALNPAILFIHGWTSAQDRYFEYATNLARAGYTCMTFDMRGHGASNGDISTLSRNDFLDDVVAAFDQITNIKGVDKDSITVVGSSFGGYMASLLSMNRPCKALCLRVPADYPDAGTNVAHYKQALSYYEGIVDEETLKWKTTIHPYTENASLRAVHEFKGQILIVESENDEIVLHQIIQGYCEAVANKNKLTYVLMKGAPHSLSKDEKRKKEFETILSGWLSKDAVK